MPTKIEWCHETWNPVTGCSPISEGCENCYARRMANRLRGRFGYPKDKPFKVTIHNDDKFNRPFKWRKHRQVFVCSMGDIFHIEVPFHIQLNIWKTIEVCSHHRFLILTKRPERMKYFFDMLYRSGTIKPPHNLWLGVTAENQKRADERIPILLQIPAAVRFVSIEPMLEEINLLTLREDLPPPAHFFYLDHLDWVIAGPETGPGARECKPEWIRNLYEECWELNVPFFDKTKKNWIAREFPNG